MLYIELVGESKLVTSEIFPTGIGRIVADLGVWGAPFTYISHLIRG